jgi:NADH:quinone reductase (non-electrogenic)
VPEHRLKVVVVGAGFGGLNAARSLGGAPVDVLLIDQRNHHLFQPLLYQVATALLDPSEVAHPVRAIVRRQRNCNVMLAEVLEVRLEDRTLITDRGPVGYDRLIVAAGAVTDTFGKSGVERFAFGLKALNDATALRNHLLRSVELATTTDDAVERRRLLTVAIAGAGPTGVEMAGATSELVGLVLRRDFPRLDIEHELRIVLVEAADSVLGAFHPRLRAAAAKTLRRKGVELRLGCFVDDADERGLILRGGERIDAATLIWTVGVRGARSGGLLADQRSRAGRIAVQGDLSLTGHPEVAVIGDLAEYVEDGAPLPMLAPVAIQQGRWVARRIVADLRGETVARFKYVDKGTMATIGRNDAVAQIGPVRLRGFLGWGAWLFVHLIQLIGFRSKAVALITWGWDYVRVDRPVRLIAGPQPPAGIPDDLGPGRGH